MIVKQPDGSLWAVWLTGWIMKQLQLQSAEIGSLIALQFIERATSATGKRFNRMSLVVG